MWDSFKRFVNSVFLNPIEVCCVVLITHNLWIGLGAVLIYWIFFEKIDDTHGDNDEQS